jgi:pantoate kinase
MYSSEATPNMARVLPNAMTTMAQVGRDFELPFGFGAGTSGDVAVDFTVITAH